MGLPEEEPTSYLPEITEKAPNNNQSPSISSTASNEKIESSENQDSKKDHENSFGEEEDDVQFFKGEPIIRNGMDVSRFIVDLRDDEDPALTFRSLVIGTLLTALASAITIIYTFKPVQVSISTVFVVLLAYLFGKAWSFTPSPDTVKNKRGLSWLESPMRVCNFGQPFGLKEHVVASLIASSGNNGLAGVEAFAIERLFYDTQPGALTVVLAIFSISLIGFGIVGFLRPIVVYPAEMVYWTTMPVVSLYQNLHFQEEGNSKKLKVFGWYFAGSSIWEVIASYIFPTLNGVSIPCLASIGSPNSTRKVIQNIFGGASSNEGLGLLNFSLDWQYIGSSYTSLPLKQQANSWIGLFIAYIACIGLYYNNVWGAKDLPILSSSLFNSTGHKFNQSAIFSAGTQELNIDALQVTGTPRLTSTLVWSYGFANAAIGALITHTLIFYGKDIWTALEQARNKTQTDPHWKAMQKYKEVPYWWYGVLFILAFVAGIIVCAKGDTTLPVWAYIVAVILGIFIAPFSCVLYGLMGNGVSTNPISKMVGGALLPGKPVAVLYFASWSHQVILLVVNLSNDLKIGQYTKVPHRVMFLTQVYGTLLGAILNYVIMVVITNSQREVLLGEGNNVWSGATVASLNTSSITWSLAQYMYGLKDYWLVPMGVLIGAAAPVIQKGIHLLFPKTANYEVNTPVIFTFVAWLNYGNTSYIGSTIVVGVVSQVWIRRRHPRWFKEYNYLVGAALDGGAQVMIFILSFAVFGASGSSRPFPTWPGNPVGNVDWCNVDK